MVSRVDFILFLFFSPALLLSHFYLAVLPKARTFVRSAALFVVIRSGTNFSFSRLLLSLPEEDPLPLLPSFEDERSYVCRTRSSATLPVYSSCVCSFAAAPYINTVA